MDMANNTATVQVGVSLELQNLKETVVEAQKTLSSLKVGTVSYKEVNKEVNNLIKLIDKLQIKTSSPFKKMTDFIETKKYLKGFENSVKLIGQHMERIQFSDLSLTSDEKQFLKPYSDRVNQLQMDIKSLQETARRGIVDTDLFKKVSSKMSTKSAGFPFLNISQMSKEVDREYKKINSQYQQKRAQFELKLNENPEYASYNIASKLFQGVQGKKWSDILPSSMRAHYFTMDGTFGDNSIKKQFIEQLQSLKILPDNLSGDSLKNLMGSNEIELLSKISEMFKSNGYGQSFLQGIKGNSYTSELQVLEKLKTDLNDVYHLYELIRQKKEELGIETTTKRYELESAETEKRGAENKILGQRLGNSDISFKEDSTAVKAFQDALTQMDGELEKSSAQFSQWQSSMRTFDSLKRIAANFLGFNQIIQIVKSSVRSALKTIKELDDVMTSISVVTDFSQSDLWGQMDTYASIAQEYAVSIKGVYEVSQIYY